MYLQVTVNVPVQRNYSIIFSLSYKPIVNPNSQNVNCEIFEAEENLGGPWSCMVLRLLPIFCKHVFEVLEFFCSSPDKDVWERFSNASVTHSDNLTVEFWCEISMFVSVHNGRPNPKLLSYFVFSGLSSFVNEEDGWIIAVFSNFIGSGEMGSDPKVSSSSPLDDRRQIAWSFFHFILL